MLKFNFELNKVNFCSIHILLNTQDMLLRFFAASLGFNGLSLPIRLLNQEFAATRPASNWLDNYRKRRRIQGACVSGGFWETESNPRSREVLPNSPNIFVAAISQKIKRAQITLDRGKVETQEKGEDFNHHPHKGRAGAHPEDLWGKPGQVEKVTPE